MAMIDLQDAVRLVIPVLALILFAVSVQSYRRTRTPRVLFFASAFGVYFLKSLFIGSELLIPEQGDALEYLSVLGDAVFLLLLLAGLLKR